MEKLNYKIKLFYYRIVKMQNFYQRVLTNVSKILQINVKIGSIALVVVNRIAKR